MTVYAVARLRNVRMGPDIVNYLQKIDGTLRPFGGHFVIHGGEKAVLEGEWSEDLIVIAFPNRTAAMSWYYSPQYQEILGLRTRNADGDVIIVDGVEHDHNAADILQ